ncbi:MAG: APC family permease [Mycoplasmoidaceae bacterium]
MKKIEIKKAKKLGLFSAISMLISSVLGIGIFLKNGGIFSINNNNSIAIMLSWTIGIIIALGVAYSFAEISTSARGNAGLGKWCEKLLGKKFGYFVKFNLPIFYLSFLIAILSFFLGDAFFKVIGKQPHFGWIALFSLFIGFSSLCLNYISIKASQFVSFFTNILKFIPIILFIIVAIVISVIHGDSGYFKGTSKNFNFSIILVTIPSILFTLDSFLVIGNISDEIVNPKKNVPLAIIIGMVICSVFYLLVTIAQILVSNGDALTFFSNIFKDWKHSHILDIITNIIIVIVIFGIINTITAGTIRAHDHLIKEKLVIYHHHIIIFSGKIKIFEKGHKEGFISSSIWFLFYWIILLIPSIAIGKYGNDNFINFASNLPTLFFYLIYAITIIGGVVNRFTKKIETVQYLFFIPVGLFSATIVTSFFCYQFFYVNLIETILDPLKISPNSGYLFFNKSNIELTNLASSLWFLFIFIWFSTLPWINLWLLKNQKNNDAYKEIMWKQF